MGIAKELSDVLGRLNRRSSIDRPSSQLKFPPLQTLERLERLVENSATAKGRGIITKATSRAQTTQALVDSFKSDSVLWDAIARRMKSEPSFEASKDSSGREEQASLGDFLQALTAETVERFTRTQPDLAGILEYALSFLRHELSFAQMDYVSFRRVWLLIWPVLNDFGLLPESSKSFRSTIQRMVTKSF